METTHFEVLRSAPIGVSIRNRSGAKMDPAHIGEWKHSLKNVYPQLDGMSGQFL